jgi:hypothetical protein
MPTFKHLAGKPDLLKDIPSVRLESLTYSKNVRLESLTYSQTALSSHVSGR